MSYNFVALFRDTPFAHIRRIQSDGQMAINGQIWPKMPFMAIYGHLAIGPYVTNMGKWGIPEKSYKNVAQQC